jgi:hypothetical protein
VKGLRRTAGFHHGQRPLWVIHVDFGPPAPCPFITSSRPFRTVLDQFMQGGHQPMQFLFHQCLTRAVQRAGSPLMWVVLELLLTMART